MSALKVLNQGHCRLVDHMGSDLSVVRSARVSYAAAWRTGEDEGNDSKLIDYMMRNAHSTPFESVVFTFDIKAPIFVFRQMHRHRTQSINELSARYTELPEEYYIPEASQITTQSPSNKQCRTSTEHAHSEAIQDAISMQCQSAFTTYHELLADGCPRELARGVLPVNTYSQMFTTMNLHNLFHFLKLRLHKHAQYEIQVYARAMLDLIEPIVPVSVSAFRKYQLGA